MAQSLDALSRTWSDAGTTFTAIKYDITDSGSAAGSLLIDLQVGGASQFNVTKTGDFGIFGSAYFRPDATALRFISGSASVIQFASTGLRFRSTAVLSWVDNTNVTLGTNDLTLFRDAANTLAQRNGANAQTFRIYNNFSTASDFERGFFSWSTTSNVFTIGTEVGGTFTTPRAIEFRTGGTTRLTVGPAAFVNVTGELQTSTNVRVAGVFYYSNGTQMFSPSNGIVGFWNGAGTDFNRLQFGGTTSSFPALKRDTVRLQARLADDSAFTNIQGKLTTETAYTAGAPTATGYLVLYDSNGTAYKVPAEAL
jgi:hypothetical protein